LNALQRQARQRAAAFVHHRLVVHDPVVHVPLLAREMWMLPIRVRIHPIHLRLHIERAASADRAPDESLHLQLAFEKTIHGDPVALFGVGEETHEVTLGLGSALAKGSLLKERNQSQLFAGA
jgi:hypothetical protein